jgi:putative ABC transport system permease protein
VLSVGVSSHVLGGRPSGGSFMPEGYPEGQTEMMDMIAIDDTYLSTLGMEIAQGRGFSVDFPADAAESILINETAARTFGWDDPVGKKIGSGMSPEPRTVVGVVADFHFSSPHRTIGPIYITRDPTFWRALFVKISEADVGATIDRLREAWQRIDPDRPFDYYFLDASYDEQYQAERNLGRLFGAFAGLAIFIACLGLYGIASFTAERRTKEIGVRKVLGSSVSGIVYLLSRELIALGLAANLVAWPVAYLLTRRWLEDFPYQTGFSPLLYIAAPLLMLAVGFLTISYLAVRAARAEPVEALRCE